MLGNGVFGKVLSAQWKSLPVAVKRAMPPREEPPQRRALQSSKAAQLLGSLGMVSKAEGEGPGPARPCVPFGLCLGVLV